MFWGGLGCFHGPTKQSYITLNAIITDIRLSTFSGQLGTNKA